MGREQTLKAKKYGNVIPTNNDLPVTISPVTNTTPPVQSINHFVKVGKGQNVFGIGGRNIDDPTTPEIERNYTASPYKNQAQKNFSLWTQKLFYDVVTPFTGGISPFSGKPLQVPPTASPTGDQGSIQTERCTLDDIENGGDPTCGIKEFFMGVPAGTYCKCPTWFPNGTTTETKCECEACKNGTGDCSNKKPCCNAWDVGCEMGGECSKTKPPDEECDLGCLLTGRGCDCGCKDMKPCTTCDSAVCKECNAWDLQCEDCKKKDGTCTPPLSEECGCLPFDIGCELGCWWEKNKNYVYIIGGIIGLGILLWLLRPLFSMIGAFKGGSP